MIEASSLLNKKSMRDIQKSQDNFQITNISSLKIGRGATQKYNSKLNKSGSAKFSASNPHESP